MTRDIENLRRETEAALSRFRRTLEDLSSEVDYISAEAKAGAVRLLDQVKQQFSHLEGEYNVLSTQPELSEEALQDLKVRISRPLVSLSILKQRGVHRRNLELLEKRLEMQQVSLPADALQATLQPRISHEQEQVQSLEAKEKLDRHEQKLLAAHRRNLELYQQMLAGERPYAPLPVLNQIISIEQTLEKIDADLARL